MAAVGDLVAGRYRLEKLLGEGGMGTVYEAVHEQIGKRVAIKFLRPDCSLVPTDVERFRQEARAAAAAGHRNIIEIFDLGVAEDGSQYLVMELLEGQSLGDLISPKAPLDEATTAYVACQVLSALDAAHAAGVVHRDLKPDNLYLVDVGAPLPDVKLLDFGISRVQGPACGVEGDRFRLTRTGTILGSPLYMSPEQAIGEREVDLRTDIYSMGVILYESVTGRVPHTAKNRPTLLAAIVNADPADPSTFRPDLSPAFEAVILRALRKEPAEQYASATEMFDALLPFVGAGAVDRISRPRGRGRSAAGGPAPGASAAAVADISLAETLDRDRVERAAPPTDVSGRAPRGSLPRTVAALEPSAPGPAGRPRPARARWPAILVVSLAVAAAVAAGLALTSRPEPGRASGRAGPVGLDPRPADADLAATGPAGRAVDASAPESGPPAEGGREPIVDAGPPAAPAEVPRAAPRTPRRAGATRAPERPGSDPGTYVPEEPDDAPGGARHVD